MRIPAIYNLKLISYQVISNSYITVPLKKCNKRPFKAENYA